MVIHVTNPEILRVNAELKQLLVRGVDGLDSNKLLLEEERGKLLQQEIGKMRVETQKVVSKLTSHDVEVRGKAVRRRVREIYKETVLLHQYLYKELLPFSVGLKKLCRESLNNKLY